MMAPERWSGAPGRLDLEEGALVARFFGHAVGDRHQDLPVLDLGQSFTEGGCLNAEVVVQELLEALTSGGYIFSRVI